MKIGVFGSAAGTTEEVEKLASSLGEAIADFGCVLISGGCGGLPYFAAEACKGNGGKTIGYSPGRSTKEHKELYGYPVECYSELVFVPESFAIDEKKVRLKYRNIVSCAECDAGIIVGGRIGTLNEFTNLYDMGKVVGVLKGSGGVSDYVEMIVDKAGKKTGAVVIYDDDPKRLVEKVVREVKSR
jgi:predicted Rossmann-fold nucleotide-binding protein